MESTSLSRSSVPNLIFDPTVQRQLAEAVASIGASYAGPSVRQISNTVSEVVQGYNAMIKSIDFSPIYKTIQSVAFTVTTLSNSLRPIIIELHEQQRQLAHVIRQFNYSVTLSRSALADFLTMYSSVLAGLDFKGIDIPDEIEMEQAIVDSQTNDDVLKKKLTDMTGEDLLILFKKAMTKGGILAIGTFVYNAYSEYVQDAARILIEIACVAGFTVLTGQYNSEVKSAIVDRVQESMAWQDTRKVIIRYVGANPVDAIAFMRTEGTLRNGASKTSPVVSSSKLTKNTVLTVVERRNNWIKVEVDSGEFCGEIGWLEESKVIKFKKIK